MCICVHLCVEERGGRRGREGGRGCIIYARSVHTELSCTGREGGRVRERWWGWGHSLPPWPHEKGRERCMGVELGTTSKGSSCAYLLHTD